MTLLHVDGTARGVEEAFPMLSQLGKLSYYMGDFKLSIPVQSYGDHKGNQKSLLGRCRQRMMRQTPPPKHRDKQREISLMI
jgi:hypothetical protein